MPYGKKKVNGGYKIYNKKTGKTYSKHAQSSQMADKQLAALHINTNESTMNDESFNQACERYLFEFTGQLDTTVSTSPATPPIQSTPNSSAVQPASAASIFNPQDQQHVAAVTSIGVKPDPASVNQILNSTNPADQQKKQQLIAKLQPGTSIPNTPA